MNFRFILMKYVKQLKIAEHETTCNCIDKAPSFTAEIMHPPARLGLVGGKQLRKEMKQRFVLESPVQQTDHYPMVNGIKIPADVEFQIPVIFS